MKRMDVFDKQVGDNIFYIHPFAAFTAANLSGELAALVSPLLSGLSAIVGNDTENIMDVEIDTALPAISDAFSSISGDKVERLMKKLLIDNKNISVENPETGRPEILTMDLANEIFCGELQDMFILCFEVIRLNFGSFFKKLGARFGGLQGLLEKVTPSTNGTEN